MRKVLCIKTVRAKMMDGFAIPGVSKNTIYTILHEVNGPIHIGQYSIPDGAYQLVEYGSAFGYSRSLFIELPDVEMDEVIKESELIEA